MDIIIDILVLLRNIFFFFVCYFIETAFHNFKYFKINIHLVIVIIKTIQ